MDALKEKLKAMIQNRLKKRKREEEEAIVTWPVMYFKTANHTKAIKMAACNKKTLELIPGFYSRQWIPDKAHINGGSYLFKYGHEQA